MKCPFCNKEINSFSTICSECGEELHMTDYEEEKPNFYDELSVVATKLILGYIITFTICYFIKKLGFFEIAIVVFPIFGLVFTSKLMEEKFKKEMEKYRSLRILHAIWACCEKVIHTGYKCMNNIIGVIIGLCVWSVGMMLTWFVGYLYFFLAAFIIALYLITSIIHYIRKFVSSMKKTTEKTEEKIDETV